MEKLTGLTAIRLVHKAGETTYDDYNVEQGLIKFVKSIEKRQGDPRFINEKMIFYFLNDKSKYQSDFFKIYLVDGSKTEKLSITEFFYFEENAFYPGEKYGHEDYRFGDRRIENSMIQELDFSSREVIEVKFETSCEEYNLPSKAVLTIY